MYFLYLVEYLVHVFFAIAYHPAIAVSGFKIGLHLVIPQLVDNKRKDLPLVRFVFEVFRQYRSETTVVVVPL